MTSSALPLRIQPSRLPRSRASARPRKPTPSRSGLTNTRTISSSPRRLRVHHFGTGISAGGAAHQREHRYQVETSHPASQQCMSTRDSPSPRFVTRPGPRYLIRPHGPPRPHARRCRARARRERPPHPLGRAARGDRRERAGLDRADRDAAILDASVGSGVPAVPSGDHAFIRRRGRADRRVDRRRRVATPLARRAARRRPAAGARVSSAGCDTGSESRGGAAPRRTQWARSQCMPPPTDLPASGPKRWRGRKRSAGSARRPSGRPSPWWDARFAGKRSVPARIPWRATIGRPRATSGIRRCGRRWRRRRAVRSHSSRAFWRRTSTRAAACVWCCATRATTPAGDRGGRPRSSSCGSLRGGVTGLDSRGMTLTTPPADLLDNLVRALEPIFRLDDLVALSSERALYRAWDRLLKRPIALRAHLVPDGPGRAWFLRENETLAALDHPAIRHVYAAGVAGGFAYRTTNWVDGESLADALRRGPRPIPTAHGLVRDLLGAVEHAHARGVIMRRIVPTTLMLEISGRAVITDLRYADWCLALVPAEERGAGGAFVAPEVRAGEAGEPASDVYTVAAMVYYALTGQEPDPDPATFVPARRVRPAVPAVLDRVLLRALQARPGDRYFTATEVLEDFVSDAGVVHEPAAAPEVAEAGFERRLRRALGDDYDLLG